MSQAEDGTLKQAKVQQAPAVENAKTGIALSRASLRVAEDDPNATADTTSVRTLTTDGSATLTASGATASGSVCAALCPYEGTTCSALWGNLDARDVYLDANGGTDEGAQEFQSCHAAAGAVIRTAAGMRSPVVGFPIHAGRAACLPSRT
ncbi:hypothetical protein AB0I77_44525 [Streptomyces sp. NPDC050619]|uniref:hypothetical protein n=1 Tax=Streptomyces sp. NPDC050619 TaxID=3157214 RepID=UPI00341E316F